jgi:hypothetical protein
MLQSTAGLEGGSGQLGRFLAVAVLLALESGTVDFFRLFEQARRVWRQGIFSLGHLEADLTQQIVSLAQAVPTGSARSTR